MKCEFASSLTEAAIAKAKKEEENSFAWAWVDSVEQLQPFFYRVFSKCLSSKSHRTLFILLHICQICKMAEFPIQNKTLTLLLLLSLNQFSEFADSSCVLFGNNFFGHLLETILVHCRRTAWRLWLSDQKPWPRPMP